MCIMQQTASCPAQPPEPPTIVPTTPHIHRKTQRMTPKANFPAVRAFIFDMDGLLLNTEPMYTEALDRVLDRHNLSPLTWALKAQLMGRPVDAAHQIIANVTGLQPGWEAEYKTELLEMFPQAQPLPGTATMLAALVAAGVPVCLATSTSRRNFLLKTSHLSDFFAAFPPHLRVLGDDPRIPPGRGKPLPDIFLTALRALNESIVPAGQQPITPDQCLVLEDSVMGVEAGRRAGMRVAWVPASGLRAFLTGREPEILAGRTRVEQTAASTINPADGVLGQLNDGWADCYESLVDFPYNKYGINIPSSQPS